MEVELNADDENALAAVKEELGVMRLVYDFGECGSRFVYVVKDSAETVDTLHIMFESNGDSLAWSVGLRGSPVTLSMMHEAKSRLAGAARRAVKAMSDSVRELGFQED